MVLPFLELKNFNEKVKKYYERVEKNFQESLNTVISNIDMVLGPDATDEAINYVTDYLNSAEFLEQYLIDYYS